MLAKLAITLIGKREIQPAKKGKLKKGRTSDQKFKTQSINNPL
jgi:hypothetical protein